MWSERHLKGGQAAMDFSVRNPSQSTDGVHRVANNHMNFIREPLKGRHGSGDLEIISDIDCDQLVLEQVSAIDFSVPNHENLPPAEGALHGHYRRDNDNRHTHNRHLHRHHHHHHHQHLNGFTMGGGDFSNKGFEMIHEGAIDSRYVNTGTSPMSQGSSQSPAPHTQTDINHFNTQFSSPQTSIGQAASSQLHSPSSQSSLSPASSQTTMDMSVSSSTTCLDSEKRVTGSPTSPDKGSPLAPKGLASRPHVLPPCKVCGAPATGFHYGANTCEACKGFFRRSLLRKEDYTCLKSIKCQIRPGKRNLCAACRYQRCLTAGMSKEGIKTGRYTYEKRTRDILELKQIHTEEAQQRVLVHQEELHERFKKLIAQVVRAQERNHVEALQTNSNMQDIHNNYLEKKKQDESPEPVDSSKPVSHDMFMKVYESTGIEIDDRRKVMESWICTAERGLRQMVSFAKDLPGFRLLPLADQIILLKNSIAEAWVITRHKAFNVDHGCYTAHNGFTFDIFKAFDKEMVEAMLVIVKRLQKLDLTSEETCILKATAFFFSDRCSLQQPEKVDKILFELMDTLDYLVRKNHPERSQMLAHLILIMTDLRNITEMYHKQNEKVLCWTNVKKAPLIWEVMSYTPSLGKEGQASSSEASTEAKCKYEYVEMTDDEQTIEG